jgi:hypothetical protein
MNITGVSLQPNPDCPVCIHEQRAAGSAMVKMGASAEEVAHALQVDVAIVETHFRDHAPIPPLDADPRSASDNELAQLLNDSTELYLQSVLQNNLTAASASLGVRLRCIAEKGERESAREKREKLLEGADPRNSATWPRELAEFIRTYQDDIINRLNALKLTEVEYGF